MKEIFILIIFAFIIQKSFELEPKRDYLNRELQQDLELPTYNWTEPEPEQIEEKYHESKKTKPVLKGFNLIKKNEEKKEDGQKEKSSLVVFFKNVGDKTVFKKYIYFYITIIINGVRVLQNENKKLVKGMLNENSLSSDNVEYIIEETEENKEIFEEKTSAQLEQPNIIFLDEDSEKNEEVYEEVKKILSETKTSDIIIMDDTVLKDINNQTYTPDSTIYFIVQDITKFGSQSYKVTGNFSQPFEMENEKELIIFYNTKTNIFNATLSSIGDGNYQMSFSLPDYIKISLNEVYALISEIIILMKRRLENDNKYERLEFRETKEDQLSLPLPTPETHKYGLKIASSGGSSGGAIAGIVIACVFVLVCLVFVVIFFMKPKPKPKDISAIDFYNSSLSVVQDK